MRLIVRPPVSAENFNVPRSAENQFQTKFFAASTQDKDAFVSSKLIAGRKVGIYFTGAQRKIMTYNAENFFRTKSGKDMKKPEGIQALAEVILKEEPDVIAFQEVGDKAMMAEFSQKYLQGKYPNVVIFDLPQLGRGIQVAIMSKQDIKVVDSKSHWKVICQEKSNKQCNHRDYLEATFETPTGYRFTVYNGHFKSMRGGEKETMSRRMTEASAAAKVIRAHLNKTPDANIVVMGDLNTIHDSQFGKPVIDRLSLKDDEDPSNDLSEVMLKDNRNEPTYRGGGRYEPKKLDYMFLSPNMVGQLVKTYVGGTFTQAPWIKASDHHPLISVIEEPDNVTTAKAKKRMDVVA